MSELFSRLYISHVDPWYFEGIVRLRSFHFEAHVRSRCALNVVDRTFSAIDRYYVVASFDAGTVSRRMRMNTLDIAAKHSYFDANAPLHIVILHDAHERVCPDRQDQHTDRN